MIYDKDIIINNIRILMRDNNITQKDIANAIGTHQSRVSSCLSGKNDFTLPQIISIANLFGVTIDELLGNMNKQTFKTNTFSDIVSLLFALEDAFRIRISSEAVEMEYDDDEHNDIVIEKGDYSLIFENDTMKSFLKEWHDARVAFSSLTDSKSLYDTWKTGVLNKYADHLKQYSYKTKSEYQEELVVRMFKLSNNENVFKIARSQLAPWELELLEEFEKKRPDLYELPFI